MAIDGKYAGHIVISDIEKPHAVEAVAELRKTGIERTVMLTGDKQRVAEQVAAHLGIDQVFSEMLPADKVEKIEEMLAKKPENQKLAFVGDGINDAPVLRRADIGIAMGAMGSDAAIEAADIVLIDDEPLKIAKAIRISRKYRVRTWGKDPLSDPRCIRHRKYVACDLCRRGRDDPGSFECDPRIVCEKIINLALPKANTWVLKVFTLDI